MTTNTLKRKKEISPLTKIQQEVFIKYYPVVRKVVNSMRSKLPSYADIDELHSAGVSGLADAIKRLDPERKDTFDGYIATRIRGAIIDELRNLDYMSRSARNDAKHLEKIREALEQRLERPPRNEEVRREMGVSEKQYNKILRRTQAYSFISLNNTIDSSDPTRPTFEESVRDESTFSPQQELETEEMSGEIRRVMSTLPDKQKRVLESDYFQNKKLNEIAKELGLTEARICQIHAQALKSLRPKLAN